MEVKIDKRFDLPVSLDQAWALLQDVHATASCMPGAELRSNSIVLILMEGCTVGLVLLL